MTSDSVSTATAGTSSAAPTAASIPPQDGAPPSTTIKIDPITAVQDSIDSLALSLFEALRGVRDAVAPESLEVPGARPPNNAAAGTQQQPTVPITAFRESTEESAEALAAALENKHTSPESKAKLLLLNGLNMGYFAPRAYDLLEPDYDSFVLSYLNDEPYAKELVDRFVALKEKKGDDNVAKRKGEDVKMEVDVNNSEQSASPDEKDDKKGESTPPTAQSTAASEDAKEADKDQSPEKMKIELGDVGYEFRKKFDSGWYTGKVIEIKPLAGE